MMKKALAVLSVLTFLTALFIFVSVLWLDKVFDRNLPFAAIVYTASLPTDHVDPHLITGVKLRLALIFLGTAAYALILRRIWRAGQGRALTGVVAVNFALFAAALGYMQHQYKVINYVLSPVLTTTIFEDHYRPLAPEEVVFPEKKRNLIVLLVESAENTFNDETIFGEKIMPKLSGLQEEGVSFRNLVPSCKDGWTFGALINFLFGMPVATPLPANDNGVAKILPGAVSLLEIFEQNGYDIEFALGSDSSFAGKRVLFNTHLKKPQIYDFPYFKTADPEGVAERMASPKYRWGMSDAYLYGWLKNHLLKKDPDQPFFLIALTINTHPPDGELEDLRPYQRNDFRDVFAEADDLAYDFVRWVQAQDFAADTTIIVLGDHPFMSGTLGPFDLPDTRNRHAYNAFLNLPGSLEAADSNRDFASFDLAPTILESAGASFPERRFGLGVSLFAPGLETFFEKFGVDYYNDEIGKSSALYQTFLVAR